VSVLPDGEHDVFVIDATIDPGNDPDTVWILDLTIVSGPHKGEVVTVRAANLDGDEFDLMGMPATLTVTNGDPTVRIDH
jgi:hypothetical protein